jgi:NADH-quinone oxidoreductase subunit N
MKALILLSSLGLITLLSEIFSFKKVLFPIILIGLAATFGLVLCMWGEPSQTYFNMMRFDYSSIGFMLIMLFVCILWFLLFSKFVNSTENQTSYYALILFALTGSMLMVSYTNMAMLFLGIEILSIPMYVMAGSNRTNISSNEAAFKYLIMGAFSTGFLLFGIALIYGATGSFDLSEISVELKMNAGQISGIFYVGLLLMLVAMLFKVSAVPFHFWAPDVYQGAPTPVTAFMATIVKTAAFAAFIRLFHSVFAESTSTWMGIVSVATGITLLLGNITALAQTNVKRMLAYSSIAHAGYMLLALVSLNKLSQASVIYYSLAYSLGSLVTFSIINTVIKQKANDTIDAFNGLAKENPTMAVVMTIALLSLAGIPPTAGFFAKYYIFTSAFMAGNIALVLLAVVASLIGVYYYFKIIIAMYFKEPVSDTNSITNTSSNLLLILLALLIIAVGLFPDCIIRSF